MSNFVLKSNTSRITLTADFAELYADGGALSPTWTVPAGITLASQSVSGRYLRAVLTGGTAGQVYDVSVSAANASGADSREFSVFVSDQDAGQMVPVSDLIPLVRGAAKGAPTPIVADEIAKAAHEFCKESGCWQFELVDLPVEAGTRSLRLPLPLSSVVVGASRAKVGPWPLNPVTPDRMSESSSTSSGMPTTYSHDDHALTLNRPLSEDSLLSCTVRLAPAQTATMLPADVLSLYRDAIVAGAKAGLLLMPSETWQNLDLAAVFQQVFISKRDKAKVRAITGSAPAQLRVKARRLGG